MVDVPEIAPSPPTVFLSYARADVQTVRAFADALRLAGIRVLLDLEFLQPGERWDAAISENLSVAESALVCLVSPAYLQSHWVEAELVAFGTSSGKAIFPVLINGANHSDLPEALSPFQAMLVEDDSAIPEAASKLANALIHRLSRAIELSPEAVHRGSQLAADIAADIRAIEPDPAKAARSVFLVHGHDTEFRDDVDKHLQMLGVQPVILSKTGGASRSLLDKFETVASSSRFAVVLMSPDDVGASRNQYEHAERGGEKTLKFRARENVILELGFFYGRLGWENVFVVQKAAAHSWPDFERPSDLAGVVFSETAGETDWRQELTDRLRAARLLD